MNLIKWSLGMVVLATVLTASAADDKKVDLTKLPPASDKKDVTFAKDIQPIFKESCFKCHGAEADVPRPKGKFRLDTLANVMKGGENAPEVTQKDIAKSPLLAAVGRIGDEDDAMPPKDNKAKIPPLTKDQVALIRAWIEQGAK